jgi:hypothetical protein
MVIFAKLMRMKSMEREVGVWSHGTCNGEGRRARMLRLCCG